MSDPATGPPGEARLDRRAFVKAAVAVGGASALSACLDLAPGSRDPPPSGTDDLSTLPARQFAWNAFCRTDDFGNVQLPRHQVLLYLDLPHDGVPTDEERATVDTTLRTLARAYDWSSDGLLFSAAYSPSYFERFDEPLALTLPQPRPLAPNENRDNVTFDTQDLFVHLASDRGDVVLAAEQALRGELDELNGIPVTAALTDALDVTDRRTGFMGTGLPRQRAEETELKGLEGIAEMVPEDAPLFMGYVAGFTGNQATETRVAIPEGPWADGTTKHVANIRQRLDDWYGEQNEAERVMEMFSPGHAAEGLVEGAGHNLGANSDIDRFVDDIERHAREFGRVGHAQKAARANRNDDGEPLLLRRHIESTDDDEVSLHFPSLQRDISQFEAVRAAMNGTDIPAVTPAVRPQVNNGILEYIFTRRRGNWLVPPRPLWALPPSRPG